MARLQDVNITDVRSAIELGCRTMSSVFNADDNDIPFFGSYACAPKPNCASAPRIRRRTCPVAISMPCSTPRTRRVLK